VELADERGQPLGRVVARVDRDEERRDVGGDVRSVQRQGLGIGAAREEGAAAVAAATCWPGSNAP
jgi:hypothetical protein